MVTKTNISLTFECAKPLNVSWDTRNGGVRPLNERPRMRNEQEKTVSSSNDGVQTSTLAATREVTGTYVARNDCGGEVRIGRPGTEGCFTPGELMRLAAAACVALSADFTLSDRLGDDFDAAVFVSATLNDAEARYTDVHVRLAADLSIIEAGRRDALRERASKSIDRLCTVGHTLKASACVQVDLEELDTSSSVA